MRLIYHFASGYRSELGEHKIEYQFNAELFFKSGCIDNHINSYNLFESIENVEFSEVTLSNTFIEKVTTKVYSQLWDIMFSSERLTYLLLNINEERSKLKRLLK